MAFHNEEGNLEAAKLVTPQEPIDASISTTAITPLPFRVAVDTPTPVKPLTLSTDELSAIWEQLKKLPPNERAEKLEKLYNATHGPK